MPAAPEKGVPFLYNDITAALLSFQKSAPFGCENMPAALLSSRKYLIVVPKYACGAAFPKRKLIHFGEDVPAALLFKGSLGFV